MQFLSNIRHPPVEPVRAAWERYIAGGALADSQLRSYVGRAWERSRRAGCDPHMARANVLPDREVNALLKEKHWLLATGEPFLDALSEAAGEDRHAAMLADESGRLLKVAGDRETMLDPDFPRPGSLLDEPHAGANGVGTALAENGYVELVGPEHYIEGFHSFTCQGAPLHGPSGETLGVLSMSVRRLQTADRVRNILFCASEAVECELLARWLSEKASVAEVPLLEDLRQDMVQRIATARLQLEVAAQRIAAGTDASTMVASALHLSRKFARQSKMWCALALPKDKPEPEPIELADLVADFLELMETEARVAGTRLRLAQVGRVTVLEDVSVMAWRVLDCLLSAIQSSIPGSVVEVSVLRGEHVGEVLACPRAERGTIACPPASATAPLIR